MTLKPQGLSRGTSGMIGFAGPFRYSYKYPTPSEHNDYAPIHIHETTTEPIRPESISWEYLPGVFNGPYALSGVELFATTNRDFDIYRLQDGDGKCEDLEGMGLVSIAQVTGPGDELNQQQVQLGTQFADATYLGVVACPFIKDLSGSVRYLSQGVASGRWENYNPGP